MCLLQKYVLYIGSFDQESLSLGKFITPICKTKPINTLIYVAFVGSHFWNRELLLKSCFDKLSQHNYLFQQQKTQSPHR